MSVARRPEISLHSSRAPIRASDTAVKRLDPSHVEMTARLLVAAFRDDPLIAYAVPDERRRPEIISWLYLQSVRFGLRYGEVFTTTDLNGVSVWLPPGQTMTLRQLARVGLLAAPLKLGWGAARRFIRYTIAANRLHRACMSQVHWYLLLIAVDPSAQGRGVGSALLAPALRQADANGLPCFLETTNERDLRFFAQHGFFQCARTEIARGKLEICAMMRRPQ